MDHILSVSASLSGDTVFIHADKAGLNLLIEKLIKLKTHMENNESDHIHFMTPAWAGNELTERKLSSDEKQVHHVKLYGWTDEQVAEHHLKTIN
jgi:hypothetical protein